MVRVEQVEGTRKRQEKKRGGSGKGRKGSWRVEEGGGVGWRRAGGTLALLNTPGKAAR